MSAKRFLKVGVLTLSLVALPSAAYAVNVSSNDGSGTQSRTGSLSNGGATVTGSLRSTTGNTVYYAGRIQLPCGADDNTGRYSSNTSSTSLVTRGGSIQGTFLHSCAADGVKSRICKVNNNLPDGCGSDSLLY